jgi:sugar phosphate isomerase/epimerase
MAMDIPLVSIGFAGCSLEDMLGGISKTKSRSVCPCAVDGVSLQIAPEIMGTDEWYSVRSSFEAHGLRFYGLEGHCDISDGGNLEKIRKRMAFTRFMGGRYIDLNAGPRSKSGREGFFRNVAKVCEYAEEFDLLVCLETHGDLIGSGKEACGMLDRAGCGRLQLCYDAANVYFYSRGSIDPVEDLRYALDCTGLIHFKGVAHDPGQGLWSFPAMKDSPFSYEDFFEVLESNRYGGMVALEVEQMYSYTEQAGFTRGPGWTEDRIVAAYDFEIDYLSRRLSWMH